MHEIKRMRMDIVFNARKSSIATKKIKDLVSSVPLNMPILANERATGRNIQS